MSASKTKTTRELTAATAMTPEDLDRVSSGQLAPSTRARTDYKLTPVFTGMAILALVLLLVLILVTLGTYGALNQAVRTTLILAIVVAVFAFAILVFVTEKLYQQAVTQTGKWLAIGLSVLFMVLVVFWFVYSIGLGMITAEGAGLSLILALAILVLGVVIGVRSFGAGVGIGSLATIAAVVLPVLMVLSSYNARV